MNTYQVIVSLMVVAQLFTLFLLWEATKRGDQLQAKLKRNAPLRDPKTGRFINMGKIK